MSDVLDRFAAALTDRYTIERELGQGGMATVYLARDLKHERQVAVKVLRPELSAALGAERFLREIKTTANLRHPHILPLYDSGEADGFLYYVMPFVEGESLRDRLDHEKQLPLEDALRIAREVADALSYAHSRDVVHRDIKPENILLESGHAVVADFGIARAISAAGGEQLTETGLAVGTSRYMSPEQASGGTVDGRSDLYSLGCVLYEMLAGQPPFTGPTAEAVLHQHLTAQPPAVTVLRPTVPHGVVGVLARVLAKTPADRFSPAAEFAAALQRADSAGTLAGPVGGHRWSGWWKIATTLVLVVAFVTAGWWITTRVASPASGRPESIAVLPLENLTNDPEQEYIADGMTEALIAELAQLRGLRVISRTSVMQYKGVQKPVPVIADELGVDAVIAGTVLPAGERIRITAQLIQAEPELHLWADTYDAEFRDILQVHSDVARAVAAGIELELSQTQEDRLARTRAVNPDAYDAYLRARFHLNKRTVDGLETAVRYFERAVQEDPQYAQAYAGLADAYTLLGIYFRLGPREAYPKAREAALRALELDDRLAEAHAALAHIKWLYDWEWEAAEREYRRAIELNPGYAIAHQFYGWYLSLTGRVDEGITEVTRARQLDPLSLIINTDLGIAYLHARRFQKAIDQLEVTLEMDPDFEVAHQTLASAYSQLEMFDSAREHLLWGNRTPGGPGASMFSDALLAQVYVLEGRHLEARMIIADFERRSEQEYFPAYLLAGLYGTLGELDRAFEWLEQSWAERSSSMMLHNWYLMEGLRDDPRYLDVLRRMNVPQ